MHCHALTICQLPSCNLFTQHVSYLLWRDTTSELWTPVHSFTLIKPPQTANCFFFHSLQFNTHFPHHTFNPLFSASRWDWQPHCFVGAKYCDCVVCRFHVGDRVAPREPPTTFWRVAAPTGSITLVSYWGKTCCWTASFLPLGVSQRTCDSRYQALFLVPLPGRQQSSARGVSRFQSLYFVFVLLSLFIVSCI